VVIRELAPGAGQLLLHAPNIMQGQVVKAIAHYKINLYKQYHGFEKKQFPTQQTIPNEIRAVDPRIRKRENGKSQANMSLTGLREDRLISDATAVDYALTTSFASSDSSFQKVTYLSLSLT
jgi:hypothetical protein